MHYQECPTPSTLKNYLMPEDALPEHFMPWFCSPYKMEPHWCIKLLTSRESHTRASFFEAVEGFS